MSHHSQHSGAETEAEQFLVSFRTEIGVEAGDELPVPGGKRCVTSRPCCDRGPDVTVPSPRRAGFTLVELLVVISIMVVLASLVFPVAGVISKKRKLTLARTELNQMVSAIETYKSKLGFYPPDNPGNPVINQLYFELEGTVLTKNKLGTTVFRTLDGSSEIPLPRLVILYSNPNVKGFANSSENLQGSDERAAAANFVRGLKPGQIGRVSVSGATNNALLVCSVKWTGNPEVVTSLATANPHAADVGLNPWRYVSSGPTNNPGSYDLWVDLYISGKTYRLSNWSKEAQIAN